ncbi:MAG: hypothetical protein AAF958_00920 [Planctomycetota bacterium]
MKPFIRPLRKSLPGQPFACFSRVKRTQRLLTAAIVLAGSTLAMLPGCSPGTPVADTDSGQPQAASTPTPPALSADPMGTASANTTGTVSAAAGSLRSAPNPAAATEVVSAFLDSVRRGGDKEESEKWLTQRSREVLASLGQSLQPMGSPQATYEVTRAVPVEGEVGAALVESFWTEPADPADPNSTPTKTQVGWGMQWETGGWRISGVFNEDPVTGEIQIIDFENPEAMAKALTESNATAEVAKQPGTTTAR